MELDLSFKTRIRLSSNSSGVLSYGSEMVLRGFAAVFATDPVLELVRALCFLVYCALKDEKKVVYVENLSLAPVGCMQKSRYVWTHHLKS